MRFWAYSSITWPEVSFLAEDENGKIVGYVLSSVELAEDYSRSWVGHINSLSVLRTYRRLGLANRLMDMSREAMMRASVQIEYIQLHVRRSNRAALSLYRDKLGYKFHRVEAKYYGDGEDAFSMRLPIRSGRPRVRQRRTWVAILAGYIISSPGRLAKTATRCVKGINSVS
ncbi:hypothetical protein HYDPIDRAFT_117896 [Hydnomerulius pinastri MD-312]|uniref:N-acetyltransferase domain-containing protein n=1 Tax=Hydnomerulius pinastri MD-312 TaxID=994086 RepID=A0A0C9VQI1_9AGAM|nr:hypothetical protein HYDPIDRAFT_117896 [Hydnomerulius pinastri MD-312]